MIILNRRRSILWYIDKGCSLRRNVSRHARVRKDRHPDKWRKPVSENGQLEIITRLQKYGKLADGKKNIDDRVGSKAWKIKVECHRVAVVSPCLSGFPGKWTRKKRERKTATSFCLLEEQSRSKMKIFYPRQIWYILIRKLFISRHKL